MSTKKDPHSRPLSSDQARKKSRNSPWRHYAACSTQKARSIAKRFRQDKGME